MQLNKGGAREQAEQSWGAGRLPSKLLGQPPAIPVPGISSEQNLWNLALLPKSGFSLLPSVTSMDCSGAVHVDLGCKLGGFAIPVFTVDTFPFTSDR